jgi:hypothetical protein
LPLWGLSAFLFSDSLFAIYLVAAHARIHWGTGIFIPRKWAFEVLKQL